MHDAHAQTPTVTQDATPGQQQQSGCPDPTPAPPAKGDTPVQPPCPPPKDCTTYWPEPVCPPPQPDLCADDDDCDPPEEQPPVTTSDCCELPSADDPVAQLTALQQHLMAERRQADQLERAKASIGDLTERIASLQQMIDGKPALATAYREFYRTTEVTKSEILCFIPTVRCQLNISDKERNCINAAIAAADTAIAKAKAELADHKARVERYERRWNRAKWKLDHAKALYEFFAGKMKDGIQAQRDDLAKLRALADPSKDRCLAEFYLREMESLLKGCPAGDDKCCFNMDGLTIGSFIECWPAQCYDAAYARALVEFNAAEWAEKCRKALYDSAKKRVDDLQTSYDDLAGKRRDTIIASLKASECCKSC